MAKEFTWGLPLDFFKYDFDGEVMEVTKYHPWKENGVSILSGQPDAGRVEYHCEEIRASSASLHSLLISWLAYKRLGLNQDDLAAGICRALNIED